jgi:Uma2 family endonuclease
MNAATAPAPIEEIVVDPLVPLMEQRHRITVAEYHQMADAGVFGYEHRVELLEGVIVDKMTKYPPHNLACDLVQHLLGRLVPPGYFVSMATSLTIEGRDGEPEPDAMVLRGQLRDYAGRPRTPADAALVVEVAESSYRIDRVTKWAMYAASGVPVYWIIDLNRKRLEVHTEPRDSGYSRIALLDPADEVPLTLDGREVARFVVRDILP